MQSETVSAEVRTNSFGTTPTARDAGTTAAASPYLHAIVLGLLGGPFVYLLAEVSHPLLRHKHLQVLTDLENLEGWMEGWGTASRVAWAKRNTVN